MAINLKTKRDEFIKQIEERYLPSAKKKIEEAKTFLNQQPLKNLTAEKILEPFDKFAEKIPDTTIKQDAPQPFASPMFKATQPLRRKVAEFATGLPGKVAKGIVKTAPRIFIDEEGTGFASPKYNEIVQKTAKVGYKNLTKEEKDILVSGTNVMFASTSAPSAGGLNLRTARNIFKVKPNATKEEVQTAYKQLMKKEYPKSIVEMAQGSKANASKLINNARDLLLKEINKIKAEPKFLGEGKLFKEYKTGEKELSPAIAPDIFKQGDVITKPPGGGLFKERGAVSGTSKEGVIQKMGIPTSTTPSTREMPFVDALNNVKEHIYTGESDAKALYENIKGEKPSFESLVEEVEQQQQLEIEEATAGMGSKYGPNEETVNKFKNFLKFAGEKKSKQTGELFREHIPASVFGVSTDEIATTLGKTENEFMAELTKDIDIVSKTPRASTVRTARAKIAKIKSTAEALKLDPEFYKVIEGLDEELKTTPSYKNLKPYKTVAGISIEPTPKTLEKIKLREEKAVKKRQRLLVAGEIGEIRNIAKNIGSVSVMGKPPGEQARIVGKLLGQATTAGIDVAIAQPYNRRIGASVRGVLINSIRGFIEKQGEAGKELSQAMLLARRRGDSLAGEAVADIEPYLDALTDEEAMRFADFRENGIVADTPALKKAIRTWDEISKRTFLGAKEAGLDIGFTGNYFPHLIPEEIVKTIKGRKEGLARAVKEGWANNITEAEAKLNQYLLRKTYRRYGQLEKPRTEDFPIYEKDPRKVLSTYLDTAWHRIADSTYFGPNDQKAYEMADKIGMEGGDVNTVRNMLDTSLGKTTHPQIFKDIESKVGAYQVITKFTPMTSIANLSQRLEVLAWTGPKAWVKGVFTKMGPEEKLWAKRTGALFDVSKKQFLNENGGINNVATKYLELIRFSPIEDMNRIFTANVGKSFIEDTFNKYLKNTGKKSLERTLERFGVDIELARMNGKLSEQDLVNASQFLNDVAQFPYKTEELPYLFNAHPLGRMLTRWKSFGYFSTKNKLKLGKIAFQETKKGNFAPLTAMLLTYGIGYQFVGEIMNDLWAFIKQNPRDEKGFQRMWSNYLWIGTVFTDAIKAAQYGKSGIYSFISGPDVSTLVNFLDAGGQLFRSLKEKTGIEDTKARVKPMANFALREVPVVGPALPKVFEGMFEEKKKRTVKDIEAEFGPKDYIKEIEDKYGGKTETDFVKEIEKKYGGF